MVQDRIYSMPLGRVGDFAFDEQVVEVFPDMISRSVPGYASVLAMTSELSERYSRAGTQVYDLGCSLGAASLLMQRRIPPTCVINAIDSSPAMLAKLRSLLGASGPDRACIVPSQADVREVEFTNSSFAVLNFTLQFIPLVGRQSLLEAIFSGLLENGALVLSEKVHFDDPARQALMTELHHEFKRANGYSDLEIAQKRTAIENALVTETTEQHVERLTRIGFRTVSLWFQCFNFISILAVK